MTRLAAALAVLLCARPARASLPDSDALLAAAARDIRAGRRASAAEELARAAALTLDGKRLTRLAGLYEDLQDYCRSADAAERLVRLNPQDVGAQLVYADAAAYCGRRGPAAAALDRAFASAHDAPDLDQLAYLYLYNGQPAQSEAASDRYVRLVPGDLWHWMRRVRACAEAGDRRGAEEALARAAALVDAYPTPALEAQYRRLREEAERDLAGWNLRWPAAAGWAETVRAAHQALARRALAQAERLDEDDAAAQAHIGLIARALGDDARARACLERAVAGGSLEPDAWLTLAELRADSGDAGAARAALAKARALSGDDPVVLERTAGLSGRLKDCGSLAADVALAEKSPDDAAIQAALAAAADRCGDPASARRAADRALARAGGDARILAAAAAVFEHLDACRASAVYGSLGEAEPLRAQWRTGRARAALLCGDASAARGAIAEAVSLSSGSPAALGLLAPLVAQIGDCAVARRFEALAAGLALDAGARLDEASADRACGDEDGARRAAGQALLRAAGDRALSARAAGLLAELRDCPRSLAAFGALVAAAPADAELRLDRAAAAETCGDRALARGDLRRAEGSSNPAHRRRSAQLHQDLGDYAKALRLLDGLCASSPGDAGLLSDRGVARSLGGDAAGAARDFEAALARDPRLASAYLSLGALYRAQRRDADARALYARALASVKPDDPLLAELRRAAGSEAPAPR